MKTAPFANALLKIVFSRCATLLFITAAFNDYRFVPHAQLTHIAETTACQ